MIIEVENLSKLYRLGSIGSTTLRESVNRAWYRLIGKEHLARRIGERDRMIPPDHPQAGLEPNTFWALKDVSFSVEQGEIVGVIGKNGAGKSTLLKILSRITEPTSGRAVLRGRVGSLLEVGTGFHPELTGRENIFLNGAILGMRRREIENKFDEIVAFAEVEKFIDTPVKRYSSGMYVRLAFAVAAHLEPEILLVDEVLAVGDTAFQKKCLGKMKDVAGEGRTVLFVSHNMAAVQQLCPRAVLLQNGAIAFDGCTPQAISMYVGAVDRSGEPRGWVARSSGGDLEVTMVRILDAYERESDVAISGQPLVVAVTVNAQRTVDSVVIQLAICGRYQERVTLLNNRMSGQPIDLPAGPSELRCRIEKNPLTVGDYTVDAKVLRHSEHLIQMEAACGFQVVDGDFFGTGQAPVHGWGGAFLCEHIWAVHKGLHAANVQEGKTTV